MNSNERPNSLVKAAAALLVCIVAASAPLAGGVAAQNFENLLMPASSQNGAGLSTEDLNFLAIEKENPLWTTYTFLRAEHLSAQQEYAKAADLYFNLVKQAHSDSKKDTWGGGSLAAFALYRWLTVHLQFPQADSSKFQELSALADDLLQQRLVRAAYEAHAVMPSLPFLEEELYHLLATAADAAKMSDKAGRYYLQYLVSMQHDSHAVDAENGSSLYRTVLEKGIATPDRIALFRAKRLFEKNLRQKAVPYMKEAHKSNSDDIRLEAAYLLARASKMPRTEKDRLYNEVYEYTSNRDLAQEALYWNALEYGFNDPQFALYLQKLIKEFPRHKYTDDALYWLGRSEQIKGNLDAALDWYRRTAEIKKHNNHAGRAAYSSSLGLILRALSAKRDAAGKTADLRQAEEILKKFQADHADSILQPHARFWLGRIAELLGENKEAARWFADCSAAFPFTYYGIRAKMHLESGAAASSQFLPDGKAVRSWLQEHFRQEAKPAALQGVYWERIRASLSSGLYKAALQGEEMLRELHPSKQIQDFTPEELDATGLFARIAVMLALRQDVLAAADASSAMTDRIWLAEQVSRQTSDWPLLITLVHPVSVPIAQQKDLMLAEGYLKTAYPSIYKDEIDNAVQKLKASADAGSSRSYENRLLPALLYSVMRNESFFYPAALSKSNALGLFQFMPTTFHDLDGRAGWNLLQNSGAANREAFLLNKNHSIGLGVRWFAEKMLPPFDQDIFSAVLAHHSGPGRVRTWKKIWTEKGWQNDFEIMIETFRNPEFSTGEADTWASEARDFARKVAADLAVADAVGICQ